MLPVIGWVAAGAVALGAAVYSMAKSDKKAKELKGFRLKKQRLPKFLSLLSSDNSFAIGARMDSIKNSIFTIHPKGEWGGHGSGFFIAEGGWALTNHHVVTDEEYLYVKLSDKEEEIVARTMKVFPDLDIALILVDCQGAPLRINRHRMNVGDDIYAIGSPLDPALAGTLTRGVVSAYRTGGDISGMKVKAEVMQTDVSIYGGNSGGPALDKHGNVTGVIFAGMVQEGTNTNLNFALPIDTVMRELQAHLANQ